MATPFLKSVLQTITITSIESKIYTTDADTILCLLNLPDFFKYELASVYYELKYLDTASIKFL